MMSQCVSLPRGCSCDLKQILLALTLLRGGSDSGASGHRSELWPPGLTADPQPPDGAEQVEAPRGAALPRGPRCAF